MHCQGRELPASEVNGAGQATMSVSPSGPGHQNPGGHSSHTLSFMYHLGTQRQSEHSPVPGGA
eukprot:1585524-Rhodomonas_salina.1